MPVAIRPIPPADIHFALEIMRPRDETKPQLTGWAIPLRAGRLQSGRGGRPWHCDGDPLRSLAGRVGMVFVHPDARRLGTRAPSNRFLRAGTSLA